MAPLVLAGDPPVRRERADTEAGGYYGVAFGLRMSSTRVRGSDADTRGAGMGLQFAGHTDSYGTQRMYTYRNATFFHLGGGASGFEGGLGGDFSWGWRAPVAANHGPFMRAGFRAYMLGNNHFYSSLLEVPQVLLGYQFTKGPGILELGARGGAVLAGRYNAGDEGRRKLGDGVEYGGYAGVHLDLAHLEASYTRLSPGDSPEGPVDMWQGSLCGQAFLVSLCADARYFKGDQALPASVSPGDASAARTFYVGFTVGLGHQGPEVIRPSAKPPTPARNGS